MYIGLMTVRIELKYIFTIFNLFYKKSPCLGKGLSVETILVTYTYKPPSALHTFIACLRV